ncbi:MAG: DUF2318 domain-containing protein [Candidatus Atribacteria bacterium]|nr:DUF2318 domain-containing protein [Candidatus Atribacteria bacterium]
MKKSTFTILALATFLVFVNFQLAEADIQKSNDDNFLGEKGKELFVQGGAISISEKELQKHQVHFFHTFLSPERPIYFIVIRVDSNYQVLANACRLCFQAKSGFYEEDGYLVCKVCGNRYRIEEVATVQEGCSPVPIETNLIAKEGKIVVSRESLEKVSSYFHF